MVLHYQTYMYFYISLSQQPTSAAKTQPRKVSVKESRTPLLQHSRNSKEKCPSLSRLALAAACAQYFPLCASCDGLPYSTKLGGRCFWSSQQHGSRDGNVDLSSGPPLWSRLMYLNCGMVCPEILRQHAWSLEDKYYWLWLLPFKFSTFQFVQCRFLDSFILLTYNSKATDAHMWFIIISMHEALLAPHVFCRIFYKVPLLCYSAPGNKQKIELELISMGFFNVIAKLCQIYFTNDISFGVGSSSL